METKLPADITYHTVNHTVGVVDAALEIGKASGLSKDELEIVELACWFHDVGYSQHAEDHEFIGADVAFKFLIERKFPEARAEQVRNCILATKMPQRPRNKLEEVVCDADLLHLAKDGFMHKTKLLQQELEVTFGHKIPTDQWLKRTCMFMENHHYFTEYARKNYDDAKQKNLEMIEQIQKKMKSENGGDHGHMKEDKQKKKDKKDKSKKKDKGLERGIETMFRLTSRNHIDLSSMADNKANIMISINAIILSVVVSVLIRRLEEFPYLVMPTIILTFVCLTTIVLSILVTRPQVALGKFSRSDIEKRKVNLLFFGNFHRMNLNDYEWAVKEMMKDGDYLYSNLIHDIYYLGVVLGKKYRLLRVSYTFFMFGFVISIVSFLVAEMFFRSAYPY
ncbi:MAG: Pycsar system effector family protein [Bacteroidota bacterium]